MSKRSSSPLTQAQEAGPPQDFGGGPSKEVLNGARVVRRGAQEQQHPTERESEKGKKQKRC